MKQRKLVIGLLIMLAVAVSGFTFAFWAGTLGVTQAADESMSITIGAGEEVVTTVTIGGGENTKKLVPTDKLDDSADQANSTEQIILEYTVTWAGTENDTYDGTSGTLSASISNIKIGGSTTNAGLISAIPSANTTVVYNGTAATITVTVTMSEPGSQSVYNDVAGAVITFDVSFLVTP